MEASARPRIGLAGLAVMGQNLALNVSEKGFLISVYNQIASKVDEVVQCAANEGQLPQFDHYSPRDFVKRFVPLNWFHLLPLKMKLKQSGTTHTLTSQDSCLLVRETLRVSVNLASPPPSNAVADRAISLVAVTLIDECRRLGLVEEEFFNSSLRLVCCEENDGRRWKYVAERDGSRMFKKNSIRAVSLHPPQAPVDQPMSFVRSYVVPEGFPDSVTPSYVPYMSCISLVEP